MLRFWFKRKGGCNPLDGSLLQPQHCQHMLLSTSLAYLVQSEGLLDVRHLQEASDGQHVRPSVHEDEVKDSGSVEVGCL